MLRFLVLLMVGHRGLIHTRMTSTSNSKNISEMMKKGIDIVIEGFLKGLNPHSKGQPFSFLGDFILCDTLTATIISIKINLILVILIVKIFLIVLLLFNWKLSVLIILKGYTPHQ